MKKRTGDRCAARQGPDRKRDPASRCRSARGPGRAPSALGLTQSADGAVVGLVAQGVRTGVTQAEVAAGQDQGVPDVRETHHTLGAVITHVVLSHLAGETDTEGLTQRDTTYPSCASEGSSPGGPRQALRTNSYIYIGLYSRPREFAYSASLILGTATSSASHEAQTWPL